MLDCSRYFVLPVSLLISQIRGCRFWSQFYSFGLFYLAVSLSLTSSWKSHLLFGLNKIVTELSISNHPSDLKIKNSLLFWFLSETNSRIWHSFSEELSPLIFRLFLLDISQQNLIHAPKSIDWGRNILKREFNSVQRKKRKKNISTQKH